MPDAAMPSDHQPRPFARNRLFAWAMGALVLVVGLATLQDFLQSMRRGGAFYFSESLLFKSVWFYFPPILLALGKALRARPNRKPALTFRLAALAALAHLAVVPPTIWLLSTLLLDHTYGLVKLFSYTIANDLLPIVLVYAAFALLMGLRAPKSATSSDGGAEPRFLVVTSGRKAQRIALDDILTVTSATPYVAIRVGQAEHLHLATLASIGKELGPRFVRIHRSMRVNIDKVVATRSRLNGDYDLTLVDGSEVRLSRHYAATFKDRFGSGPRLGA